MPTSSMKYFCYLLIAHNIFTSVKSDSTNFTQKLETLVTGYGYPFEIHHVQTEDGYILELHRIPHGIGNNDDQNSKSVALLKHGLIDSSASFMFAGPNVSLAFLLADNGYDVWMSNSRGNLYSRKHKTLSTQKTAFWNFSWHEFGVYDLPAVIDFILEKTKQEKVFHVCVSEGCTELYVMASLKPEYNDKIAFSANLAPAVFFKYPTDNAKVIFGTSYILKKGTKGPLEKVTIPVAIFHGLNDAIISVKDVEDLAKRLSNHTENTMLENFNHLDVYLHHDIKDLVYNKIIKHFASKSNPK